ncbi:MAG TPA: ABC transporter substrate-binding protein, partial [Arenimonas sp.]|nr:ABC transporter substrate-binding protein [Arenimonas sp.]
MLLALTLIAGLLAPLWVAASAQPMRLQLRWLHQFQFAGYYMALEKGYYAEEGLQVEILEGGPRVPKPVDALLEGRAEFAIGNSGVVVERMAGRPVVALAAVMQNSPIVWLVRADSGIFGPQDLADRKLMLMPPPESAELLLTLRSEGIDLDKLDIQPTNYNLKDLVEGRTDAYDAYVSNEPFWLAQQGVEHRMIRPRDYGVHFYSDVLVTREDIARRDPRRVEAFVRASLRGWQYALENVDETIALIQRQYAPSKSLEHLRYEAQELGKLIMPDLVQLGHMNPARWETIANSYVQLGMSPGPVELDGFLFQSQQRVDYGPLYRIAAASTVLVLVAAALAWRFASLNRRLQAEASRRQKAESELRESRDRLEILANTDRLTGLWNRLHFETQADEELKRCARYHYPLALLFIDIDHFKSINDQHGHGEGDRVLCAVASTLRQVLRSSDTLCRWGGEEFLA